MKLLAIPLSPMFLRGQIVDKLTETMCKKIQTRRAADPLECGLTALLIAVIYCCLLLFEASIFRCKTS